MAQRTILADDIEGTEGGNVQTYTFTHEGKAYEIDLNDKNATKMFEAFKFYADHGRLTTGKTTKKKTGSKAATGELSADRQWLKENGFPEIKNIGALSKEARAALDAHKAA